jgi:hypothetical protein
MRLKVTGGYRTSDRGYRNIIRLCIFSLFFAFLIASLFIITSHFLSFPIFYHFAFFSWGTSKVFSNCVHIDLFSWDFMRGYA